MLKELLKTLDLKKENKNLNKLFFDTYEIVGESEGITKIKNIVKKIATTETRALILGPAGSGKELIARTIHKSSLRKDFPFVVCNGAFWTQKILTENYLVLKIQIAL